MTSTHTTDVLIVGAGPCGLMLACELALAGVEPIVVDRLTAPTGQSRALGFTVGTIEILAMRGILDRFDGLVQQDAVHFAGLPISAEHLGSLHRPANQYPQSRTEAVLAARATELGVSVRRGWELVGLEQSDELVTTRLVSDSGEEIELAARYVVASDGGSSRIRGLVGAAQTITEPSVQMLLADVRGCGLPNEPFGVKKPRGMVMSAPLGDGTERLIVCEYGAGLLPQGVPVTMQHVSDAYERVTGRSLAGGRSVWASSFTDAGALADRYLHGRVVLLGDSAHTHLPAGGQGMNVGIQDAVNLGFKLAAVVQGRAGPELLQSYEDERRPVGVALLENTAAQGQLFLRGPEVDPLRSVLRDLIRLPDAARRLGRSVSGLDIRYACGPSDAPDLVGTRLDLGAIADEDRARATEPLTRARAALLVVGDGTVPVDLDDVVAAVEPLDVVAVHAAPSRHLPRAVLVRPDGHVVWAEPQDLAELRRAANAWCGLVRTAHPQAVEV